MKDISYLRSKEFIFSQINGEYVVIDAAKYSYIELNETGQCLIKYLVKKRTLHDMVNHLSKKFLIQSNIVLNDITKFIHDCEEKGIVAKVNK